MIEELKAVLERIKKTSSKNSKVEIISEFKNDENIRKGFNFLFNDFIITGLALKKIEKDVNMPYSQELDTLDEVMTYLEGHKTGSDVDIANIQNFLSKNESNKEFLIQFLTKTFKAGITAKSVNKGFGEDFIPEFACQLANSYEKFSDKVTGVFTLTTKLDGHRTIVNVDKFGKTTFFTRKGKSIFGLEDIASSILDFANNSGLLGMVDYNHGFVLDGEITISELEDKSKTFQETGKLLRKDGLKKGLTFHVFDLIPKQEFFSGESSHTYLSRRDHMEMAFSKTSYSELKLVPCLYMGEDTSLIKEYLDVEIKNGEEGIMINTDEVYKNKRHSGLLKVKEFFTDDLLVTGVYKGGKGTKYDGLLGGVYVDYKGNKVSVGSGFDDKEREVFIKNPKLIVGKVIEVQYFEETTNQKDNGLSLRFPTFKGIREDKDETDVNIES